VRRGFAVLQKPYDVAELQRVLRGMRTAGEPAPATQAVT